MSKKIGSLIAHVEPSVKAAVESVAKMEGISVSELIGHAIGLEFNHRKVFFDEWGRPMDVKTIVK
jgi:hypothetical protein